MNISSDNLPRELDWGALKGPQLVAARLNVLLRLTQGEVPYDRLRGLDPGLIGTPVKKSDPDIRREVDRIMKWEPAAKLTDLKIEHQPDGAVILHASADV